jgi:hypothetical protein
MRTRRIIETERRIFLIMNFYPSPTLFLSDTPLPGERGWGEGKNRVFPIFGFMILLINARE